MKGKGSIIAIIAAALVISALASYLIYGRIVQYKNVAVETFSQRMELVKDQQKLAALQSLSRQEVSLEEYINKNRELIPDTPDEIGLIDYLRAAAGNTSNLQQIKFDERKNAGGYVVMPFTMTFEGTYSDLLAFIGRLKDGKRAVRLNGFNIARSGEVNGEISADLTAEAFCMGE